MDAALFPAIGMSLLTAICLLFVLTGLQTVLNKTGWPQTVSRKIFIRTIIVIAAWITLTGLLAAKGFFSDFKALPPRPALAILIPVIILLIITFSAKGKILLKSIPPHWLIAMQAFRIIVELLLWRAVVKGLLPVQMSFEGQNFDVLSGLLAIPVALAVKNKWQPKLVLTYNIIGLLLLVNILVIAVLSMPTSLRYFMNEPANTLVAEFPFIYLPAVLVPLAAGLHIFSLRQWWLKRKTNTNA